MVKKTVSYALSIQSKNTIFQPISRDFVTRMSLHLHISCAFHRAQVFPRFLSMTCSFAFWLVYCAVLSLLITTPLELVPTLLQIPHRDDIRELSCIDRKARIQQNQKHFHRNTPKIKLIFYAKNNMWHIVYIPTSKTSVSGDKTLVRSLRSISPSCKMRKHKHEHHAYIVGSSLFSQVRKTIWLSILSQGW